MGTTSLSTAMVRTIKRGSTIGYYRSVTNRISSFTIEKILFWVDTWYRTALCLRGCDQLCSGKLRWVRRKMYSTGCKRYPLSRIQPLNLFGLFTSRKASSPYTVGFRAPPVADTARKASRCRPQVRERIAEARAAGGEGAEIRTPLPQAAHCAAVTPAAGGRPSSVTVRAAPHRATFPKGKAMCSAQSTEFTIVRTAATPAAVRSDLPQGAITRASQFRKIKNSFKEIKI
mgnify:CR=1 FL=1